VRRYAFVDWLRGFACVLMFQTHAYDAWVAPAGRQGAVWWLSRHLGGFPSRLFLLLAGVSLALRFDGERRRGTSVRAARWGAIKRGLEVLALAYAFRVFEWALGGGWRTYARDLLRVDILNCIGISLVLAALVTSPRDLEAPARRAWRPLALALAIAFLTPLAMQLRFPAWVPRVIVDYVYGDAGKGTFALLPWLAYVLTGCTLGAAWIDAARRDRLGFAILVTVAVGAAMGLGGQLARRADVALYSFGDNSGAPPSPTAYFYRTGMCLLGAGLAYLATSRVRSDRFSPMRLLGRASLFVYWIHVELVYGHASDLVRHKLSFGGATILLAALCALMIALAWWRTERLPGLLGWQKKPAPPAAPARGTAG
jgi:uncharacterized membrane protein